MSNPIKITIAAHCDKAAREHNEDNCLICSNVASGVVDHIGDGTYLSHQTDLGEMGCLLVVADGMGGMNAGEVASQMAVESVRKFFSKDKLDEMSMHDETQISRLIWDAIVYADACIKSAAVTDSGKSGMGTTIVVLWILGRKAYIGWCGDSRIYRFNKQSKILTQLSKDHSYVQMLVDQHQITEEEAFDHPDSKVLLKSLGDAFEGVTPELLRPLNLTEDDVFMMCSDGLCGVLRNNEIRSIMTRASVEYPIKKLNGWHELLWDHARQAGWHDNVTTLLCHIGNCTPLENESPAHAESVLKQPIDSANYNRKEPKRIKIIALIVTAVVLVAVFVLIMVLDKKSSKEQEPVAVEQVDETVDAPTPHKSQKLPPAPNQSAKEHQQAQPAVPQKSTTSPKASTKTSAPQPATAVPQQSAQPAPAQAKPSVSQQQSNGASGEENKTRSRL